MALNLGPSIILSGSYNTQSSRLNFEGLTYTLVGSTFTVSQITQNGGTAFLSLTGIQAGTYASLIVGNYIVGPGIPACSKIVAVVTENSGAGTGTYRMSCAQPVGLSGVAGCSAATAVYTNYGQVVASAPAYTTGSQRGQLDFYAPTATQTAVPTMSLTNGNVGIGKTQPLAPLDVSGSVSVMNGNLAIGKQYVNPTKALDISGSVAVSSTLDISGSTTINGTLNTFYLKNPSTGLILNTTGSPNITGSGNHAIGYYTLDSITTGQQNTAFGSTALNNIQTGSNNTGIGNYALNAATGDRCSAIGSQSLQQTTGSDNTAVGFNAGYANTTGTNNTFVGSGSDANGSGYSNSTALGYGATITASNQIMLGRAQEVVTVPGELSVSGNTFSTGDTIMNGMVEKYTSASVVSNALTITYLAQTNVLSISPSSDANISLTITNIPTTRNTAFYDFTFVINVSTYKRYINALTVNGSSVTMKAVNGISNIFISTSSTVVMQSITVQMNGATVVNAFTNVANYF